MQLEEAWRSYFGICKNKDEESFRPGGRKSFVILFLIRWNLYSNMTLTINIFSLSIYLFHSTVCVKFHLWIKLLTLKIDIIILVGIKLLKLFTFIIMCQTTLNARQVYPTKYRVNVLGKPSKKLQILGFCPKRNKGVIPETYFFMPLIWDIFRMREGVKTWNTKFFWAILLRKFLHRGVHFPNFPIIYTDLIS